ITFSIFVSQLIFCNTTLSTSISGRARRRQWSKSNSRCARSAACASSARLPFYGLYARAPTGREVPTHHPDIQIVLEPGSQASPAEFANGRRRSLSPITYPCRGFEHHQVEALGTVILQPRRVPEEGADLDPAPESRSSAT